MVGCWGKDEGYGLDEGTCHRNYYYYWEMAWNEKVDRGLNQAMRLDIELVWGIKYYGKIRLEVGKGTGCGVGLRICKEEVGLGTLKACD